MIIINHETENTGKLFYFHSNALVELVASLHVYGDPKHHKQSENWVKKINNHIGDTLRSEILYFADNYHYWLFIMDTVTGIACSENDSKSFDDNGIEEMIKKYSEINDFDFAYVFLCLSALNIEKSYLEKWIKNPDKISKEELSPLTPLISYDNVVLFLKNINKYKQRLINIFEEYWDTVFKKEWQIIKEYIAISISEQTTMVSKANHLEYLANFNNGLKIINNQIVINKEVDDRIDLDGIETIHIFPSVFTEPHLMIDIRDTILVFYYNLSLYSKHASEKIPEDIILMMTAFSDENRIRMIKILWEGKTTTQKLSKILNIAPSTVSTNLKLFKRANLVRSKKENKFVYYEAEKEQLEKIWTDFNHYLSH